jgi:hypothetical protein
MLLTVLIPVFRLDNDRKRNLEFIYNRLISHYDSHSIEILFSIGDEVLDSYFDKFDRATIKHFPQKSFNKSYLFNQAIKDPIKGNFLVFLDVDVYLPFYKLKTQLLDSDEIELVNHWVPEYKLELHKQPLRDKKLNELGI